MMLFAGFGLLFIVAGFAISIYAPRKRVRLIIGGLAFIVGVVIWISGVVGWVNNDSANLECKAVLVTAMVVEVRQTEMPKEGCVCVFTLANVPYTFHERCSNFVKYSFPLPRAGDEVRVMFVAPKKMGGKPKVLEFYNLTQALERMRYYESLAPDASLAD